MAVRPTTPPLPFFGHKSLKVLTGGGLAQLFPHIPCNLVWPCGPTEPEFQETSIYIFLFARL